MSFESDAAVAVHESADQRFTVASDPEPAVLHYIRKEQVMVIDHTFVPSSLRGMGIAGILTRAALEYARAEGLKVEPACGYVDIYIRRHKEWTDLRA